MKKILFALVAVISVFLIVGCVTIAPQSEEIATFNCVATNMESLVFVAQRAAALRDRGIHFLPMRNLAAYAAGPKRAVEAFLEDMSRKGHIVAFRLVE